MVFLSREETLGQDFVSLHSGFVSLPAVDIFFCLLVGIFSELPCAAATDSFLSSRSIWKKCYWDENIIHILFDDTITNIAHRPNMVTCRVG